MRVNAVKDFETTDFTPVRAGSDMVNWCLIHSINICFLNSVKYVWAIINHRVIT